jgi:DNA modification methylase
MSTRSDRARSQAAPVPCHSPELLHLPTASLTPYARNARSHSRQQIAQIARSIETFGFTNPILVDAGNRVIAGHGRLAAGKQLGLEVVPALRLEGLSEAQLRAYVIADNRLAEKAGWDKETLALELQGLADLEIELDVTITGFETAEIDVLIQGLELGGTVDAADELPAVPTVPVSETGDLWRLGSHLLLCGDALSKESYGRLMGGELAELVFTDPPYNVPVQGHVSGLGKVKHAEFAMASGEMSAAEFTRFLGQVFDRLVANSADGSLHYVCMDWRHAAEVLAAKEGRYADLKNICVWAKTNGGMGSLYRSAHEFVFLLKNGSAPHVNNVELGKHGRYRTNVWTYAGVNAWGKQRSAELAMHPTVKPVALVADAIKDCSRRGGIVLDPFGGSGTTLIAAERTGRVARLIELEPKYVDVAIRRYETLTGRTALLEGADMDFDSVRRWREAQRDFAMAA